MRAGGLLWLAWRHVMAVGLADNRGTVPPTVPT
jgi:hypothetical protein